MGTAKRDFLSFWDLKDGELPALLRRAEEFRFLRSLREPHATRPGRVLGMIFEKASTRTRVSFEVATFELGGHAVVLGKNDSQLGRGEPIADTARVLSGYCHAVMVRTFGQDRAEELAPLRLDPGDQRPDRSAAPLPAAGRSADGVRALFRAPRVTGAAGGVPADVLAVLRSVRYAWIGDGNNMANSLDRGRRACWAWTWPSPARQGFDPDPGRAGPGPGQTERGRILITRDPREAVAGRQVISTDVFASMGQEAEAEARRQAFAGLLRRRAR